MIEEQQDVNINNNEGQTKISRKEPREDSGNRKMAESLEDTRGDSQVTTSDQTTTSEQLNSDAQEMEIVVQNPGTADDDDNIGDDIMEDDFVIVANDEDYWYEARRAEFFAQMEAHFAKQIERCDHYRRYFEQQENLTMVSRFAGYSVSSGKHLEILKNCWRKNDLLPRFEFEQIAFSCLPINLDVQDKELQLIVKTKDFPQSSPDAIVYCIGEFEFPYTKDESFLESLKRWRNSVSIDPQTLICCSNRPQKQIDRIYATDKKSFINSRSGYVEYNRPLEYYVDKGKSRTLRRKFKNIKLTFYEKSGLFRIDRKIGYTQVKIDAINDEHSTTSRSKLVTHGRPSNCIVEVVVRVHEPLTNKLPRSHIERILVLK